jgi:hypothetical protein
MVELFVDPDAGQKQAGKDTAVDDAVQRRRWVRLEVFSPVEVRELIADEQQQSVRKAFKDKSGMILNISGGGVLLSTFDDLCEDDYLLMKFKIKDFDALSDILGRVKRVESCPDGERLVGIEFLTPDSIKEPWLADQLADLVRDPLGFSDRLHRLVSRYVFSKQMSGAGVEKV